MKKKEKKAVFIRWKLRSGCLVRGVQLLPLMHREWWKMSAASRSFEWVSVGHLKYQNRTLETLWVGLKSRGTPGHAATLFAQVEKKKLTQPLFTSFHYIGEDLRVGPIGAHICSQSKWTARKIHEREVNSCLDTHEGRAGAFFCRGLVNFMRRSFQAVFL